MISKRLKCANGFLTPLTLPPDEGLTIIDTKIVIYTILPLLSALNYRYLTYASGIRLAHRTRISGIGLCLLSRGGSHIIADHCDGESPVDEAYGSEQTGHQHIFYVACFSKEVSDDKHQDTIDEI